MPRPRKTENNNSFGTSSANLSHKAGKETESNIELFTYSSTENKSYSLVNEQKYSNFRNDGSHLNKMPIRRNKLSFKNKNWVPKFRTKEKTSRVAKNIKSLMQEPLDNLSFNLYQSIEAGPSVVPKKKYCDLTGFESNYTDPKTGLRYYNSELFKIIQNFTEPIKNQYLALRKALFIIK